MSYVSQHMSAYHCWMPTVSQPLSLAPAVSSAHLMHTHPASAVWTVSTVPSQVGTVSSIPTPVSTVPAQVSNSTPMDLLNATDSSQCTSRLSSLACLTSVPLSCSLWRQRCSLAPDEICLSYSVDSSALSYTERNLPSHSVHPSHRTLKSFSTCANLKCTCTFVFVCLI